VTDAHVYVRLNTAHIHRTCHGTVLYNRDPMSTRMSRMPQNTARAKPENLKWGDSVLSPRFPPLSFISPLFLFLPHPFLPSPPFPLNPATGSGGSAVISPAGPAARRFCAIFSTQICAFCTQGLTLFLFFPFKVFSERELTFTFAICYRPSVCRL